jgi:uncharacterized protein
MKHALKIGLAAMLMLGSPALSATQQAQSSTASVTNIALDAPWKQKLYAFAREKLKHPAWGLSHSERDYRLAMEIAAKEHLAIDTDILFAAAFVHDLGAIGEFQKAGVDHADRSAELAGPLLRDFGFPAQKIPAVSEAIIGHMHDRVSGKRAESIVLHDADTLDFLGTIGAARRLSVTGNAAEMTGGLAKIGEFADQLPGQLVTRTARKMAEPRVAEMRRFLAEINAETADGRLP